jgi:hypothetical protein
MLFRKRKAQKARRGDGGGEEAPVASDTSGDISFFSWFASLFDSSGHSADPGTPAIITRMGTVEIRITQVARTTLVARIIHAARLTRAARDIPVEVATKRPNQSPEPTVMSVTPRAGARVAPATTVAHL